jgi:hypothetical protein
MHRLSSVPAAHLGQVQAGAEVFAGALDDGYLLGAEVTEEVAQRTDGGVVDRVALGRTIERKNC